MISQDCYDIRRATESDLAQITQLHVRKATNRPFNLNFLSWIHFH